MGLGKIPPIPQHLPIASTWSDGAAGLKHFLVPSILRSVHPSGQPDLCVNVTGDPELFFKWFCVELQIEVKTLFFYLSTFLLGFSFYFLMGFLKVFLLNPSFLQRVAASNNDVIVLGKLLVMSIVVLIVNFIVGVTFILLFEVDNFTTWVFCVEFE